MPSLAGIQTWDSPLRTSRMQHALDRSATMTAHLICLPESHFIFRKFKSADKEHFITIFKNVVCYYLFVTQAKLSNAVLNLPFFCSKGENEMDVVKSVSTFCKFFGPIHKELISFCN